MKTLNTFKEPVLQCSAKLSCPEPAVQNNFNIKQFAESEVANSHELYYSSQKDVEVRRENSKRYCMRRSVMLGLVLRAVSVLLLPPAG